MKHAAMCFAIACLPLLHGSPVAGPANSPSERTPLRLTLEMPHPRYRLGEPISCKIVLTNASRSDIRVLRKFLLEDHYLRLEILDARRQRVPFLGPEIKIRPDLAWVVVLRPAETIIETVPLFGSTETECEQRGVYDLTREGKYRATAVYSVCRSCGTGDSWEGEVRSNEVLFEIAR